MGPVPVEVRVVDVMVFRPVLKGWQVLVLRRRSGIRCPGSWEMVHGKVEDGESLEAAALRELAEETGLVPTQLLSVTMHPFYLLPKQTVQLAAVFAAVVRPDAAVGYSLGESAALFALRAWRDRDAMLERMESSTLFTTDLEIGRAHV